MKKTKKTKQAFGLQTIKRIPGDVLPKVTGGYGKDIGDGGGGGGTGGGGGGTIKGL